MTDVFSCSCEFVSDSPFCAHCRIVLFTNLRRHLQDFKHITDRRGLGNAH